MSVELRPLSDRCNIQCRYCYQEGTRAAATAPPRYSLPQMMATLDELGEPFVLFGGEALLVRDADLERLFAYGLERHGVNAIQTNGALIEPHHIALFRRYNVRVGISLDGPGSLNDMRWAGSAGRTLRASARAEAALARLCREGLAPSAIVTLHGGNTRGPRLDVLCDWIAHLHALGVRRMRLHLLEVDQHNASRGLRLSDAQNLNVLRRLRALEPTLPGLRFDLFDEMRRMLLARDAVSSCIWQACDPYATRGVRGVEGGGERSNCGRTHKDGIAWLATERRGYERQLSLHETPHADGGCRGCRFFLMCKGNCPGTALEGDWRLRSEHCATWFGLFEDIERTLLAEGEAPLSQSPRRAECEAELVALWREGLDESLQSLTARLGVGVAPATAGHAA